ncbi:MAG: ABC transporter permease [Candidatus Firestonebacteria bacterium]|nr:ABC transporter permease [Candidatus Firestonebacteria bacterium]
MNKRKFSPRGKVWGKIKNNRLALLGASVILVLSLMAILGPMLTPFGPEEQSISERLLAPHSKHICGTDELGRDVFSRMLSGARVSLSVGFIAVIISSCIGIIIGAAAGYYGGRIDSVLMRFVDIMLSIPTLFLILILSVYLGPSIINVMVIIGLTGWMDLSRLIRAEFLSLKKREYVLAARVCGASDARIIFKHILPNALAPVFVSVIFGVGGAILAESGLSFLGLGVQPPDASWGSILASGKDYIERAWWMTVYPGLAIFITIMAYNLLGEGLRDALDPRLVE